MNFVYYIAYYVVNMYLRKAPERFGGFYNADEVDMCSRLTSLPSSHLVLHPELCDIAIDKLVDSYVFMLGFLLLGYVLSYGKDFVKGCSNWIQMMVTLFAGRQAEKDKKERDEAKKREAATKAAATKQKNAVNAELVKQLVYFLNHDEDVAAFKQRMRQQIQQESTEYKINMDINVLSSTNVTS